jgi:hypothetical protein
MNDELFELILKTLRPETLARLAVDIEYAQEDWQYYPEEAPSKAMRKNLEQTLDLIIDLGTEQATAAALNFQQMLHQIRDKRQKEDWSRDRDQQERQNWLKDYE